MASFILLESSRLRLSKEKLTPDEIVRRKEMALFSAIEKQRKFANHSLELGGVSIRGSNRLPTSTIIFCPHYWWSR